MISGVGPAKHLKEHNIPVVHHLPGVGSHLVDHPVVDLYFKDKTNTSLNFLRSKTLPDTMKLIGALLQYKFFRSGFLATNVRLILSHNALIVEAFNGC